jgi:hypothetical protein
MPQKSKKNQQRQNAGKKGGENRTLKKARTHFSEPTLNTLEEQPIVQQSESNVVTQNIEVEAPKIAWNSNAEKKVLYYARTLEYSDRHQRRIRANEKKKANGSLRLDNWLGRPTSGAQQDTPQEQPAPQTTTNEEEWSAIDIAFSQLIKDASPVINRDSTQQKRGIYEQSKYQAVSRYFSIRLDNALNHGKLVPDKIEASEQAARDIWFIDNPRYRGSKIREYADEYLKTGKITIGAQGKHSKRTSILDDNDIKRKVVKWLILQPKSKRSIPAVQNYLKKEVLPKMVNSNTLPNEVDTNHVESNPLSFECKRRKLIQWGFHYKNLGKRLN